MTAALGEARHPEDVLALRNVDEFEKSIQNLSTEENYLRPRMEHLVDLGLIGRKTGLSTKPSDFAWMITDRTRTLAAEWGGILTGGRASIEHYIEHDLFTSMSRVFDGTHKPLETLEDRLLWFGRAFALVRHEFGFTPGRMLALMACLLAWEQGHIVEIAEIYDAVYAAADTPWGKYLHFSGGSRFDREFLIRLDAELVPALEDRAVFS